MKVSLPIKTLLSFSFLLSALSLEAKSFEKLENFLFTTPSKGVQTEAFVLQKEGEIVFSRYDHGNADSLHLLWSMSKSVFSLLFGIAEEQGRVNRQDSLYKFFPKEIDALPSEHAEALKKIRLVHLLHMSSGLDWKELYEEDPFKSNVVEMLYLKATGSMANYVLKTPVAKEPGEFFLYSSGDTNLLAGALKRALPKELQNKYPWLWLFDPMGMEAIFEQDGSGTFVASSYSYLKTKDLLKLGQLIIDQGSFQGRQVVPKEYIEYATSLSSSMRKRGCLQDSYMTYGAQFWLNKACPSGKRPFPLVPEELVMLLGHGGQSVFIFPAQKIVAVRIANDKEQALDKQEYAKLILEALNEN